MAIQAQLYSENIGFPLCGSQDWIDNGCGGGFNNQFWFGGLQQKPSLQQLQQLQQFQQLQNQQQSILAASSFKNNGNNNNRDSVMSSSNLVEKQRHDIDQFIRSQNERLSLLLQEQRKQLVAVLVKKIESKASVLLRQKDEEIAKATNKTMELENLLRKLEFESQAWQRVAQENEAMVLSLNNTLEQLREQASCCFNNGVDDAESCCEVNGEEEGIETEENRGGFITGHVFEQEKSMNTKESFHRGHNLLVEQRTKNFPEKVKGKKQKRKSGSSDDDG
ncbi:hypothetical protein CCACVL1_16648 [Corchorus capsularis]|uniref:Uncharacterized protein n=1 Tax=Corchorus capsularis TaxID=210143 RepID=A0A1R3HVX9_COCAP|nr:hypothetical protein CCACVL1_16648 [Corchorus capsularis]